jgi:cytochrome c-type biogenesis protein CcmH
VGLALLAAAVLGFVLLRSPKPAPPAAEAPKPAASAPSRALAASQVETKVDEVQAHLREQPADAAAWAMLANSKVMLGDYDAAAKAFEKLRALRPKDAQILADYADALGLAKQGSLRGAPEKLIAEALALDPGNFKARVLAAKLAFEAKRYEQAIQHWQAAASAAAGDAEAQRQIQLNMAEARSLLPSATPASAGAGGRFVSGRVVLAPQLAAQVQPGDTLFVFARPVDGSRMPVALLKRRVADLPFDFALDDSLAMVPQAKLSGQRQVLLGARISRRGDAIAAPGDLQGSLGPVEVGSTGLKLEINDVVR